MQALKSILSAAPQWTLLIASAVGITAASIRVFESEETKRKRSELRKQKELRYLTQRISVYARSVHERYPTGDVIVSERDLAQEFRKRPDVVITALNLLLNEQKVQRAPLRGYWKLNV
jgi:galactitol-specific phosphotransferase system IIB component